MSHSALFIGLFSLAHATDILCDVDDEHALLQARVVTIPHQLAKSGVDPALLLASVRHVAHHLAHESPEVMNTAIDSVNAALGQMLPLLEEDHTRAQNVIQLHLSEIQACHRSESHGSSAIGDLADQLAVMSSCIEDQVVATETQQRECDEWSSHASRLQFPPTSLSSSSPAEVYEIAARLQDWVQDHWPAVESQHRECNEATAHATEETERCSPVIAEYDATFCQHHLSCNLLSACHNHEVEVYNSFISDSESGMFSRQDQYRTLNQIQCILRFITDALNTNATIDESSLDSCDGDVDVGHLALTFPDPQSFSACPPPQSGDPQCPELQLPEAWESGEAVILASTGTLVETGFEYYDDRVCLTGPGSLGKRPDSGSSWSFAFDTRTSIMPGGSGPQGFSFQCKRTGHCIVGLQQAGWNGANPVPSQPSTWDTSSTSSFKEMHDAITNSEPCYDNECASAVFQNGVDIGITASSANAYVHDGNDYHARSMGAWLSDDTVFALVFDGNEIKWYMDGAIKFTRSLSMSGHRQALVPQTPLWVVAVVTDVGEAEMFNFQYINSVE